VEFNHALSIEIIITLFQRSLICPMHFNLTQLNRSCWPVIIIFLDAILPLLVLIDTENQRALISLGIRHPVTGRICSRRTIFAGSHDWDPETISSVVSKLKLTIDASSIGCDGLELIISDFVRIIHPFSLTLLHTVQTSRISWVSLSSTRTPLVCPSTVYSLELMLAQSPRSSSSF
jgi:hypothetical protein